MPSELLQSQGMHNTITAQLLQSDSGGFFLCDFTGSSLESLIY